MAYIGILLMGALPYYIFFKSSNRQVVGIIFAVVFLGFLIYNFFYTMQNEIMYRALEIVAFLTSVFTFWQSYKTYNLSKLSYYFLFLNTVIVFALPHNLFYYYYISVYFESLFLFFLSMYYVIFFGSANFSNVQGLALKSPKLALMLRLTLMGLGLYPPFGNIFLLFAGLLKGGFDLYGFIIFVWIFFANFFMAFRIMKNTVFGVPNENIVYRDIDSKHFLMNSAIIIMLILLGIGSFLEVMI